MPGADEVFVLGTGEKKEKCGETDRKTKAGATKVRRGTGNARTYFTSAENSLERMGSVFWAQLTALLG